MYSIKYDTILSIHYYKFVLLILTLSQSYYHNHIIILLHINMLIISQYYNKTIYITNIKFIIMLNLIC